MARFHSQLLQRIAPEQIRGKETLTYTQKKLYSDDFAVTLFHEVQKRLFDINHWQRYAGWATAHFQLLDKSGTEVHREVQQGDFFQIDIPGPGSSTGKGNDWVEVRKTGSEKNDEEEIAFIVVRTSANPLALEDDTAHFFNKDASSTFFIIKKGLEITAGVLGRNELPNTQTARFKDRVRNLFVAIGAMLGLSNAQWKALTYGLLNYHQPL